MFSHSAYQVLHLLGILVLFMSIGGLCLSAVNGLDRASNRGRKLAAISHGVAMLIILVAGFGMLARLGISGSWPGWVWGKLVIWVLLGAAVAPIGRKPELARLLWFVLPVLGGLAAYLAIYKPI